MKLNSWQVVCQVPCIKQYDYIYQLINLFGYVNELFKNCLAQYGEE